MGAGPRGRIDRIGSGDYRYIYQPRPGGAWYAVVEVPRALQEPVGKKRLIQSLKTRDLREAQRLRWPVVSAMKEEIASAAGVETPEARRDVLRQALQWRETLRGARDHDE